MAGKRSADVPTTAVVSAAGAPGRRTRRYLLVTAEGGVRIHGLPAEGAVILGRGPECDVVIDDASISRRHARPRLGPACTLRARESGNGTRFRGRPLPPGVDHEPGPGDSFSLGRVTLLLVPAGVAAPTSALGG